MAQVASGFESLITIDNTKVDATLTNYPIMVKLTSGNFDFSTVRTDGFDIAFYDNSDTLLAFETEYFDKPTSSGVFHVKIPSISSTVDTTFKMKYGDNNAVDLSNKAGVWDSNFVMVQHMGTSLLDSTANGNDGTNYGSTVVDGLNGKGRVFDGTNDYIEVPNSSSIDLTKNLTITILQKIDDNTPSINNSLISKLTDGSNKQFSLDALTTNTMSMEYERSANNFSVSSSLALDVSYNLVTLSIDNLLDFRVYKNADKITTDTSASSETLQSVEPISIGRWGGTYNTRYYSGEMDEVRMSNVVRSDAWIKADDYNLRLNSLLTIGA